MIQPCLMTQPRWLLRRDPIDIRLDASNPLPCCPWYKHRQELDDHECIKVSSPRGTSRVSPSQVQGKRMTSKAPHSRPAQLLFRARLAWVLLVAAGLPWLARAQEVSSDRSDAAKFRQRVTAILSDGAAAKGHWGA